MAALALLTSSSVRELNQLFLRRVIDHEYVKMYEIRTFKIAIEYRYTLYFYILKYVTYIPILFGNVINVVVDFKGIY